MNGRRSARTARAMALALVVAAALAGCAGLDASWSSDASQTPRASELAGGQTTAPRTATPPTTSPKPAATAAVTATPSATPSATATAKPTVKASATPAAKASPTASPSPKPRTTLKLGDRGPKVLALQQRLTDLGYWLGKPDGNFGSLTKQAVYALQKAAGISRDGVIGPKTAKALADGIRPRATLSGNGVEIVLDRQLLLVVRGGTVKTILNTSTGNRERYTSTSGNPAIAVTPKGTFKVYRGVDGPLTNSLGQLWRPRFFHRGIAVHGSPNIPPWPASHGCARLSNAAINMIWDKDLMPIGSTVVVR